MTSALGLTICRRLGKHYANWFGVGLLLRQLVWGSVYKKSMRKAAGCCPRRNPRAEGGFHTLSFCGFQCFVDVMLPEYSTELQIFTVKKSIWACGDLTSVRRYRFKHVRTFDGQDVLIKIFASVKCLFRRFESGRLRTKGGIDSPRCEIMRREVGNRVLTDWRIRSFPNSILHTPYCCTAFLN